MDINMKYLLSLMVAICLLGCIPLDSKEETIDFSDTDFVASQFDTLDKQIMYIAVASMVSPKETFRYYNELIQLVAKSLNTTAFLKQKKTYNEVNELLANSEVTFAFICSGAYVTGAENMKIIAVPQISGSVKYQAYVVVNKSSYIETFEGLKGRSFVYTDPISNTGKFYPYKRITDCTDEPESYFSATSYTYGHNIALQMVDKGIVDGASVNSLIFDYMKMYSAKELTNIKIIEKSEFYGSPPIVAPNSISQELFDSIQSVFLNLHLDSTGKSILQKLNIDRFIEADDKLYDNVRLLKNASTK